MYYFIHFGKKRNNKIEMKIILFFIKRYHNIHY